MQFVSVFFEIIYYLQIEELLKEVELKEKKRKVIDAFLHEVNDLLNKIPTTEQVDVSKCNIFIIEMLCVLIYVREELNLMVEWTTSTIYNHIFF